MRSFVVQLHMFIEFCDETTRGSMMMFVFAYNSIIIVSIILSLVVLTGFTDNAKSCAMSSKC